MGCHIYIQKLSDDSEVQLPYFISCHLLDHTYIKTKKEFEAFLIFHKLMSEDYIVGQEELLYDLQKEINGEPLGVEGHEYDYYAIEKLLEKFHRNSGFLEHEKNHDQNSALLRSQAWEIERAKGCSVTQEMIDKLLSIFVEGEHYICTG
jgi:hypothetical protein